MLLSTVFSAVLTILFTIKLSLPGKNITAERFLACCVPPPHWAQYGYRKPKPFASSLEAKNAILHRGTLLPHLPKASKAKNNQDLMGKKEEKQAKG